MADKKQGKKFQKKNREKRKIVAEKGRKERETAIFLLCVLHTNKDIHSEYKEGKKSTEWKGDIFSKDHNHENVFKIDISTFCVQYTFFCGKICVCLNGSRPRYQLYAQTKFEFKF